MEESLHQLITNRIIPHVERLMEKVSREKDATVIDGVKSFNGIDFFVPGKAINVFSYILALTPPDHPDFSVRLRQFQTVLEFTINYELKTWGIYYYLTGLKRLQDNGLLGRAVSEANLGLLREKLDWRKFINEADLSLINLPTNYYGCGLGVARLREELGWEPVYWSQKLYDKLMEHIEAYSGEYGFADEIPGEGRFDRYSVLLPGEICARLVDTGLPVPEKMKAMLRRSCEVHLKLANREGHGFNYGRTIGTYGDTSVLEVLSIAAYLNLLSDEEKELAYAYSARITKKFVNFWLDPGMGSVNLWEHGRKADPYMNKNRILGENFSLSYQHIHTAELWNRAGFQDKIPSAEYESALAKLPRHYWIDFARDEYHRGLAIIRDRNRVISLPIISGGNHQYQHTPYFPIPFSIMMLEASPAEKHPNLIPRFTLTDGSVLMPLAYQKEVQISEAGEQFQISYHQDELCRMGGKYPQPDPRLKLETTYRFAPGMITRVDCYTPVQPVQVSEIYLEFATYSTGAQVTGSKVVFNEGPITEIELQGLDDCSIASIAADPSYNTPHGALKTKVSWKNCRVELAQPWKISWILKY